MWKFLVFLQVEFERINGKVAVASKKLDTFDKVSVQEKPVNNIQRGGISEVGPLNLRIFNSGFLSHNFISD